MRNGFIFFVFTFLFFQAYSQDKKLSVNYDFKNHGTDAFSTLKTNLTAVSDIALFTIFKSGNVGKTVINSNPDMEEDPSQTISSTIIYHESKDIYVYKELSTSKLIHSTSRDDVYFKVEESIPNFTWQLHNENKLIDGISVNKATVDFRGRHYTAWYAPSIPLPYGPWKFGGLPGLILDIYDDFNKFRWSATSVKYPYEGNLSANEPNWNDYKTITLREKVELYEKEDKEYYAKLRAKLPKGVQLVNYNTSRGGIELIYEWEKE